MKIRKGLYDTGTEITLLEENNYDIKFEEHNFVNGREFFTISFDEIDLYGHDELNYAKYYYHPNKDVYYNRFKRDTWSKEWLNVFGIRVFFSPIYQLSNSISFKKDGEWFSFTTNDEYILEPIIDGHHTHARIFLKGNSGSFYKWKKGKVEYKKTNKAYLPKPSVISCELFDYYLFKGYDFYEVDRFFDIRKGKDDIREALNGLDYYFVGTSIYDNARDIDIYVNKKDYEDCVKRLEDSGFEKINWSPSYVGSMFIDKYTPAKIDVITSPYSNYTEPVDEDNNADPLLMYFIQVNYYASIRYDNLTELFKIWRFNKLLETAYKLGLQDGGNSYQGYFVDSYISNERFQKYYDIFSHSDKSEILERPDNPMMRYHSVEIDGTYYSVVNSKHRTQLIYFDLPYKIKNLTIIDDEGVGRVVTKQEDGKTKFQLRFLKDYILFSYEKDE